MKTFMFPGQGSQSRGMGGNLFDEYSELTKKADKILGYSIKELCLKDPRRELNKTQFTQPALFVVNTFSYLKKIEELGVKPDYVIGHSLGEFNALLAADCFDFETGLKLVKKRGELMSQATDGAMVAILNASKEEIETILAENGLTNIDLANYNTPSQIVISGPVDEIGRAEPFFQKGEMLYYPLNTSGAFHSRFMQPSREKFEAYLKKFKLSNLKIPVVANVTAKPYHDEEVMTVLSSQISSTVRWCESIQYLLTLDSASNPMEFVEMGSGDVLTKMVDRIKTDTPKSSTGSSVNKNQDNAQAVKTETGSSGSDKILPKAVNELNKNFVKAEEKVSAWNKKYPVGTKVKSSVADYGDLETRTEAIVLFGHRAAVYMKEYNGYFDLEEVTPA